MLYGTVQLPDRLILCKGKKAEMDQVRAPLFKRHVAYELHVMKDLRMKDLNLIMCLGDAPDASLDIYTFWRRCLGERSGGATPCNHTVWRTGLPYCLTTTRVSSVVDAAKSLQTLGL